MPVPPKPASKRRRRNVPKSYGAATPTTAPAAKFATNRELGIDSPHPLIEAMWATTQDSCESRFYSEADWARLRLELWNADQVIRKPTATAWAQVQRGLSDMLISPAAKRRLAIEMKAAEPDLDEAAAVSMLDEYRDKLQSVKPVD